MAEVVLSVFLEVLLERLASGVLQSFVRRKDILPLVTKLKSQLPEIAAVIQDAEDRTLGQAHSSFFFVQSWLDDLRNLAYEIDELLDKFATEEGVRELSAARSAAEGSACMGKVRSLVHVCFGSSPTRHNKHIKSKIDGIELELNSILNRKTELGLRENRGSGRYYSTNYERASTCLLEPFVVGLEADQSAIVKYLTSADDINDLLVIPIIGTGGIGKTTLAQVVYNNPVVIDHFDLRGWAYVSERFDMLKTMGQVLASMVTAGGDHQGTNLNVIECKIRDLVSGKRFLIVLDDYWSDNYGEWSGLIRPFANGAKKGSRIIVTSRSEKVASIVKSPAYHIGNLSENDHLSLFAYHALGVKTFDAHPQFEHIAVEIVRKCGGLPLAIKILAGALCSENNVNKWLNILNSEIWRLPQFQKEILPALWISYFCLPPDLRGCFVYCSVFPKGYEFDPNELALLWMAEGLVVMRQQKNSMRCQGLECFEELLRRSFFECSSQNSSRFVMHYLMHDLATSIGQLSCLNVRQGEFIDDTVDGISKRKIRHLSYFAKRNEASKRLNESHNFKGLRTFLALPTVELLQHPISSRLIEDLLQQLKSLRALSLRGYEITEVPDCISYLKLLRYLDLSGSKIHELPESTCNLYNLETLILKRCDVLSLLPKGIRKLSNLRCLDISDTPWLKDMPLGLGELGKLEILPKFVVGGENEVTLKELKPLHYLQEELTISNLQNVVKVEDAGDANLKDKQLLSSLILEWDASNDLDSEMTIRENQLLELLQPHTNIIRVGIVGYGGVRFPSWIEDPSFVNIKHIRLHNCRVAERLPSLGILPFLEEVEIKGMSSVSTVGPEFCGRHAAIKPFQSLQVLKLIQMPNWKTWAFEDVEETFPKLIQLELQDCPKLRESWPPQLNVLVKLKVLDCPLLVIPSAVRFISSLREIHLRCHDQEMMSKTSSTQCFRPNDDLPMVEPMKSVQPHPLAGLIN